MDWTSILLGSAVVAPLIKPAIKLTDKGIEWVDHQLDKIAAIKKMEQIKILETADREKLAK